MRILYHHRTRAADAQGVHIRALCEAFRRLGHQVEVVGPVRESATEAHDKGDSRSTGGGPNALFGITLPHWLYELLALLYNGPAFLVLVFRMLVRRPGLLYERYALFNVSGRLAAAVMRVPFVLEVNAPLSDEMKAHGGLVFQRLARAMELWLCRSATRTVVVSGVMRDLFVAKGCPQERFLVVPNAVDRKAFNPELDGGAIRRRLGFEGCTVVGFVGWIRPWHGVEGLVDAVAGLVDRFPGLRLLLVGDGPAVPELRDRVAAAGIVDRVHFCGAVAGAEVPAHVAAMDVAVQPDVTEYASPIKLFEYLAMGRAVVAPAKANIREIVTDGEQALLFPPGDTNALSGCLERLLADPGLRQRLSQGALDLVARRQFYWEANAQAVLQAIGRGGDPARVAPPERGPDAT